MLMYDIEIMSNSVSIPTSYKLEASFRVKHNNVHGNMEFWSKNRIL